MKKMIYQKLEDVGSATHRVIPSTIINSSLFITAFGTKQTDNKLQITTAETFSTSSTIHFDKELNY